MDKYVQKFHQNILNLIFTIRGKQVMIDEDLADLYGIETKYLIRAVKRNLERFPESFMFQLTKKEYEGLRFQIGTSNKDDSLRFQNDTLNRGTDDICLMLLPDYALPSPKWGKDLITLFRRCYEH